MYGSAFYDKNVQISSLYRFLFIPGSTAHKLDHKQKAHVLLCKVGQSLLCALQCHWLATSTCNFTSTYIDGKGPFMTKRKQENKTINKV